MSGISEKVDRIGLAGRGLIGADLLKTFEYVFPSAQWMDIETEMCGLQAAKTKSELDVIRRAYRIAELGIEAAVKTINPGVNEREVAARDRSCHTQSRS